MRWDNANKRWVELPPDITRESHPDHHTVGRTFKGGSPWKRWLCVSHDAAGYNMQALDDPEGVDVHSVSERAIGRAFHWDDLP